MLMTRLSTYAPGSFVNSFRRDLDDAFEKAFGNGQQPGSNFQLPLTIWEDSERIHLEVDVPGFDRESVDLTFQDGNLWIRAERKVPREDGKYWHNERIFGKYERVISLPETIDSDSIEAELSNGILYVTLTKKPEARPTKIAIKACDHGQRKRLTESVKKE